MTSMRIDAGASAKLWAKRLKKLTDAINDDGGLVFLNVGTYEVAVHKNGQTFTTGGREVPGEL